MKPEVCAPRAVNDERYPVLMRDLSNCCYVGDGPEFGAQIAVFGGPADATANVADQHAEIGRIEIAASGPQAPDALAALKALVERKFDED